MNFNSATPLRIRQQRRLISCIVSALTLSSAGWAQCAGEILEANDPELFHYLGSSVAINGNHALVGARNDSDVPFDSGSVYFYERSGVTWALSQEIKASDAGDGARFGWACDVDGTRLAVGAPNADGVAPNTGAAYVFEFNGNSWNEVALLTSFDAESADGYGADVYLAGDLLFVGASGDDVAAPNAGSIYIYEKSGSSWNFSTQLTASDAASGDALGASLAVDGNTLVAGARFDDDFGPSSGTAFVFESTAGIWNEVTKLHSTSPGDFDFFASEVSISGDTILVGAHNENHGGNDSGAAYVYERVAGVWQAPTRLLAEDATADDDFGWSVAVLGDRAVIGALESEDSGAAYVFERSGGSWSQSQKLTPDNGAPDDAFSWAVDLDPTQVLVGASQYDGATTGSGAAFAFDLSLGVVSNYCGGGTHSLGGSAIMSATGSTSISANDMGLFVSQAVPNRPGIFFYGPNQIAVPFGEGTRCVGGSIFRLPPAVTTSVLGTASRPLDFTSAPTGGVGAGSILPGSEWNFQFWFRDPPGGPSGFNLSDGLNVTFCP